MMYICNRQKNRFVYGKIILVEDEINIASFIERGLREFGHEVSVVYDGNAGWELLQNESLIC